MAYDSNGNQIPDAPNYQALLDQINALGGKFDSVIDDRNKNYVKPMADGTTAIAGGKNLYGIDVPDYQTMTKQDGTLGDNFKQSLGESSQSLKNFGNSYNDDLDARMKLGMNDAQLKLKDAAMSTGDMEEYGLMRQQLNNKFNSDVSNADGIRQGQMATQNANLAMRGGLNAGASERMANASNRSAMMDKQSMYGQNRDANMNLSLQNANARTSLLKDTANTQQGIDSANISALNTQQNKRLDTLSNVASAENAARADNVNALRQDRQNLNLQKFGIYDKNMEAWGASKTADGQAAAGGGGGGMSVICTQLYVQGKLTRKEFRDAHDFGSTLPVEMFAGYLTISKPIVKLMMKSDSFSNLFINWAKCLANKKPNTFTKMIMPIAHVIGYVRLNLESDFSMRMMAKV